MSEEELQIYQQEWQEAEWQEELETRVSNTVENSEKLQEVDGESAKDTEWNLLELFD